MLFRSKRHLEEVKNRISNIEVRFVQIPREENECADRLAKAASVEFMLVPKQVCLESNGQMSTLLPHIEKVFRVDGRMPESLQNFEEIPFIPTTTQPV